MAAIGPHPASPKGRGAKDQFSRTNMERKGAGEIASQSPPLREPEAGRNDMVKKGSKGLQDLP